MHKTEGMTTMLVLQGFDAHILYGLGATAKVKIM